MRTAQTMRTSAARRKDAQLRYELALKFADRNSALEKWRDRIREVDHRDDAQLFAAVLDVLGPLLEFLSKAQNSRAMGMRVWALLYAVRPELVKHATIQQGADWFGVTDAAMCYQLKHLEGAFPGFEYVRRTTPQPDVLKARMAKANAASVARFRERRVNAAA